MGITYTQQGMDDFIDGLTTDTAFIQDAKKTATRCLDSVPKQLKEVEKQHLFVYLCFRRLISLGCQELDAITRAAQLAKALNIAQIPSS